MKIYYRSTLTLCEFSDLNFRLHFCLVLKEQFDILVSMRRSYLSHISAVTMELEQGGH